MNNYNKTKSVFFSIAFLLFLTIPSFLFFLFNGGFDFDNILSIRKENPKSSVFQLIDKCFKSKFGMKKLYLQVHSELKYSLLSQSSIPNKVVVGKNGWFYIGNESSNCIYETLKSTAVFSLEEKKNILNKIKSDKSWLDTLGVSYYTCVAPNKMTVYPEFYYSGKLEGDSKFEDLKKYLSNNDWNLIDLKSKIMQKKDSIRLYHKTDSHWNDDGAYLGYLKLLEELNVEFPEIVPVKRSEFDRSEVDSVGMDLSFMLGLNNIENNINYKNSNPNIIELKRMYDVQTGFSHEDWEYEIRYRNKNGLPFKVMLVRDSFSRAWLKYLIETFEEVVLIWDWKLRREMIEKENPDILIREIIERDIECYLE